MITVYQLTQGPTGPRWCAAFAQGANGPMLVGQSALLDLPGDVAFWGDPPAWPLMQQAREAGRDFYYGDHGYFGRGLYYRCTRNAMQHIGMGPGDRWRFERFGISVRPWRKAGRHILVCPNSPAYFQLHGLSADAWVEDVIKRLAQLTDRPVVTRWKRDRRPLELDLVDAWATVVFTSGAGVASILEGVPCIALGPCAAATMGGDRLEMIENPPRPPGRADWAACLAAHQWTLDEYRDGTAWRALQAQRAEAA